VHQVIIGLGITGRSCLRYLDAHKNPGDRLTVLDTRPSPADGTALADTFPEVEFAFGVSHWDFSGVHRVVVSPGVALSHCLVRQAVAKGVELCSDIDLFCNAVTAPIYAITGTNGKSTVTALSGHLLGCLGRSPGVGGNLGEPALDLLSADRDCYVLELSSFQLERMSAHEFSAATILNVSQDHLDRHGSMADYVASKHRIYRRVERAVANRQDQATFPRTDVGQLVTFGDDAPASGHWGLQLHQGQTHLFRGEVPFMPLEELPLAGTHNALNVLAALALVADTDVSLESLAFGVSSFRGLPHRCERVAEIRGVSFIDDSKATNVGATLAALEGLDSTGKKHLVLIAGGDGKGADFSPLKSAVAQHVKAAILLGRDAPILAQTLAGEVPIARVETMEQAVAAAMRAAEPGDAVLLSPACASLDMFANYAARGFAFAAAVEAQR
jgi:UDP-N-acetylmuramoylalanine--D-glutamate ligase